MNNVEKLKRVRDALHNIGGNVYHGMADDVRNNERSPDWQYILEQVKIGIKALDELIDQQSKGVDAKPKAPAVSEEELDGFIEKLADAVTCRGHGGIRINKLKIKSALSERGVINKGE